MVEGDLPRERSDALQQAERISPQVMESISTPEQVETHLGTLEFPLGVPTDETADRIYDHLDHLDGVRAFLDAYSGVNVWAARKGFLETGVKDHDVLLFSEFMDPSALVLTGNADTVYFLTFLDLTEGPVVVEMPPLTLSFVNDMSDAPQNGVPDTGRARVFRRSRSRSRHGPPIRRRHDGTRR
jgi:hypothetical protein